MKIKDKNEMQHFAVSIIHFKTKILTFTIFKNGHEIGVDFEKTMALVQRVFPSETEPLLELSLK